MKVCYNKTIRTEQTPQDEASQMFLYRIMRRFPPGFPGEREIQDPAANSDSERCVGPMDTEILASAIDLGLMQRGTV